MRLDLIVLVLAGCVSIGSGGLIDWFFPKSSAPQAIEHHHQKVASHQTSAIEAFIDASMGEGSCDERLVKMALNWRELRRMYGELYCERHGIGERGLLPCMYDTC